MTTDNTPALPNPDLTDADVRALLQKGIDIVAPIPQSAVTDYITTLLATIVAQRVKIMQLEGTPKKVSDSLQQAFDEGVAQARGE